MLSTRVVVFLTALVALLFVTSPVIAAPALTERQIGDLQCNIDRGKTVASLAKSNKAVAALAQGGADTTAAQSGLDQAGAGIKTIAQALVTGQTAPADARTQVGDGLTAAQTALASMNTTDAAGLTAAQSAVNDTLTAGQGVVSNCK